MKTPLHAEQGGAHLRSLIKYTPDTMDSLLNNRMVQVSKSVNMYL